ncbi:E3 ubiquitin-protein ligase ZSWIM2 isoform X3 [Girardinichthys multiradiatus]|uniref:E3 ubiquitin-protein ligase ZSWIM2 isoform X3 n=1 Tax=Girardinichthys multiradiatus TaxID=208333 RepID=UPI001FABEC03|nr:E3 ubiquitin-protein ligase ZSWIM2 isoform X3 [Girardinichthys multiradiatus]
MSRKTTWRNTASDAVSLHQDQALSTTMLLLRSFGPAAFLLREDGETRSFKVCLGEPHTCTCPAFTKEQQPCKHICWLFLRKFRLPREHEYAFQLGLSERQLLEVLQGLHLAEARRTELDASAAAGNPGRNVPGQEVGSVCRKVIQAQDVCPICQEGLLLKKQPVSYCRFSCGNSVHISCMKMWADHQRLSDSQEMLKCPLCREDFSSLKLLQEQVKNAAKLFTAAEREKPDRHLGVLCCSCRVCPITGTCFNTVAEFFADSVLEGLPAVKVRSGSLLLNEGMQCRICLESFRLGQQVRTLPCHHKFHMDCVDQILLRSNSCPLDGYVIFSQKTTDRNTSPKSICTKKQEIDLKDLFVPGIPLHAQSARPSPACGALNLEVLLDTLPFSHPIQKSCASSAKKTRDNKAARRTKVHLKDMNEVKAATLELRMTGVSINTQM